MQLTKYRQRHHIKYLVSHPLPLGIFADGKIKQWELLQWQLIELGEKYLWHGTAAGLALPASLARIQHIQLPAGLSDSEIETEVYLHIQRDLPGITDTLCADFTVSPAQTNNHIDVIVSLCW